VTIGEALADASRRLKASGVPAAHAEALALWGVVSPVRHVDRSATADTAVLARFRAIVERRAAREPFSHISGRRLFYNSSFYVTPDVLDPRAETETLVELACSEPVARVLDLGTGTGCILISLLLEQPGATGVGTDISAKALQIARKNGNQHSVADRLSWLVSNWFHDVEGRFDLIVANPPYIAMAEMNDLQPEVRDYEPRIALTDGADGLSAYKVIAAGARDHLTGNGRVLVEIGPTQAADVSDIFGAARLSDIRIYQDLDGRDRVVAARA